MTRRRTDRARSEADMPTINHQACAKADPARPKPGQSKRAGARWFPQRRGVCTAFTRRRPRSPIRRCGKVAKVRLTNGFEVIGWLSAVKGHNLQEHSVALLDPRRPREATCRGVRYHVVRGSSRITAGVKDREQSRSKCDCQAAEGRVITSILKC